MITAAATGAADADGDGAAEAAGDAITAAADAAGLAGALAASTLGWREAIGMTSASTLLFIITEGVTDEGEFERLTRTAR